MNIQILAVVTGIEKQGTKSSGIECTHSGSRWVLVSRSPPEASKINIFPSGN